MSDSEELAQPVSAQESQEKQNAAQENPEQVFADIADARDAKRLLEALLFSSKDPLRAEDLGEALPDHFDVTELLKELQVDYEARGIVLENNGIYWAFRTASDLAERLTIERVEVKKLSRAGLETLAIIAYHQPVTRAEIEDIRGVAVARGTVDALLELGWIRPRGRKRAPGRPLMWGTSDEFLDHFGLSELEELPGVKELKDSGLLDRAPTLAEMEDQEAEADAEDQDTDDDDANDDVAEGASLEVGDEADEDAAAQPGDISNVVPLKS